MMLDESVKKRDNVNISNWCHDGKLLVWYIFRISKFYWIKSFVEARFRQNAVRYIMIKYDYIRDSTLCFMFSQELSY